VKTIFIGVQNVKIRNLHRKLKRLIDNQIIRDEWIVDKLKAIPANSKILDAGCGSQRYRKDCGHLQYYAQDFGGYTVDDKESFTARTETYEYGQLDYRGDIWNIAEKDSTFDIILCTEVFEHIPYPNETIQEFYRLLKHNGKLILTAPSNCLRHMDPCYYYSGFSDRYFEFMLAQNGFINITIEPVGSYHSWLFVEVDRCMRHEGAWAMLTLWPALIYHYLKQRRPTHKEVNTLCFGYHVIAEKASK